MTHLLRLLAFTLLISTSLAATPATPDEVVRALYKQHQIKTPFFQTRNRAALDKFFAPPLAALIWKDAQSSKKEPGAINGDPLLDAQDYDPKDLVIHPAQITGEHATVEMTFTNYGEKKKIIFSLFSPGSTWLISDIRYAKDRTLFGTLKETYP